MRKDKCRVYLINNSDFVVAETKEQAIEWYKKEMEVEIDTITESSLDEEYNLTDGDGFSIVEGHDVLKTIREGIDDWFKKHERKGFKVNEPWIICSYDDR